LSGVGTFTPPRHLDGNDAYYHGTHVSEHMFQL